MTFQRNVEVKNYPMKGKAKKKPTEYFKWPEIWYIWINDKIKPPELMPLKVLLSKTFAYHICHYNVVTYVHIFVYCLSPHCYLDFVEKVFLNNNVYSYSYSTFINNSKHDNEINCILFDWLVRWPQILFGMPIANWSDLSCACRIQNIHALH